MKTKPGFPKPLPERAGPKAEWTNRIKGLEARALKAREPSGSQGFKSLPRRHILPTPLRSSRLPQILRVRDEMLHADPAYSPRTIHSYVKNLCYLDKHVDLNNASAVCSFIRTKEVGDLRKMSLMNAYGVYCKVFEIKKPVQKLRGGLKKIYRKVPEVPSEEIIQKIIDQANIFYSVLFEFLRDTGCRTIEVVELKVEDLRENVLTVHTAKAGGLATRQLKISDSLLEKLKRHVIKCRKTGYLFERNGRCLKENRMRKAIIKYRRRVVEKYGIREAENVHLHTFRHYYASRVYQETKDLVLVKSLLGHSNIKSTEIYTHVVSFDSSRCEAKAVRVDAVDEICTMISKGWKVEASTKEHLFMKHYLL